MKRSAAVLSGLLLMAGCAPEQEDEQDEADKLAIIGGTEAIAGSHPWLVSLQAGGASQCGGTLISPSFVLTAAHCFRGLDAMAEQDVTLVFGEHNTAQVRRTEQRRTIKHVEYHPGFLAQWVPEDEASGDDLAIVELSSPVRSTATTQTLPLPSPYWGDVPSELTVAGWGASVVTTTDEWFPDALQETTVSLLPSYVCSRWHIKPNEFCAGSRLDFGPTRDTCGGDSGGAVTTVDGNGQVRWVGVVSRGGTDCDGAGVYTRVDAYTAWIRSVTGI